MTLGQRPRPHQHLRPLGNLHMTAAEAAAAASLFVMQAVNFQ